MASGCLMGKCAICADLVYEDEWMLNNAGFVVHETCNSANPQAKVYKHFKGNLYVVIEPMAKHTETDETLVIYKRADGTPGVWARPFEDFHGMHESGVKRFEEV